MKKFLLLPVLSILLLDALAQGPCDDLIIEGVTLNGFDMDFITIEVTNNSMESFNYPGFRVYNAVTDELIGEEIVNFFGIAGQSVHQVPHNLGDVNFDQAFLLRLELWEGFYSNIACNFVAEFVLRPSSTCFDLNIGVNLFDNTQASDTIYWTINDSNGNLISQGTLYLDPLNSFPFESLCLDVNCYEISFTTSDEEANLGYVAYVNSILFLDAGSSIVQTGGGPTNFQFGLFDQCIPKSVTENERKPIKVYPNPGNGILYLDATMKGEFYRLIDANGRIAKQGRIEDAILDLSNFSKGLYLLSIADYRATRIIIQ